MFLNTPVFENTRFQIETHVFENTRYGHTPLFEKHMFLYILDFSKHTVSIWNTRFGVHPLLKTHVFVYTRFRLHLFSLFMHTQLTRCLYTRFQSMNHTFLKRVYRHVVIHPFWKRVYGWKRVFRDVQKFGALWWPSKLIPISIGPYFILTGASGSSDIFFIRSHAWVWEYLNIWIDLSDLPE